MAMPVEFPGNTVAPCNNPTRKVVKVNWTTIYLAGDFRCAVTGQIVRGASNDAAMGNTFQSVTQAGKAAALQTMYSKMISVQGSDGLYPVAGVSHWAWSDDTAMSGSEWGNFGFVTSLGQRLRRCRSRQGCSG